MGVPDLGGGPKASGRRVSLASLTGPAGQPDTSFTLEAATGRALIGGIDQDVMTFNGVTPGPTLTVHQGDLVEVRLINRDITRGVTIHWHGVDVPGGEDGVAGVTQDAVLPGDDFVYRFVVPDTGTYWYHSHQFSVDEVGKGLVGALVVLPREAPAAPPPPASDTVAVVHTYGPAITINGSTGPPPLAVPAGGTARVRFVNTDNGPVTVTASQPFRVASIDGSDVHAPSNLSDTYVLVAAGGRADLDVDIGEANVRVGLLTGPSLVIGPNPSTGAPPLAATRAFDALTYGTPDVTPEVTLATSRPQRTFDYRVGLRFGYLDGKRGNWFTINGRIIPQQPVFIVHPGDVVEWRMSNTSLVPHPMHLHGQHWLVVSRNGVPSTGSPWWVDSLEVDPGERYVLRMIADNPGVWMFHCHNLPHANSGLMTVLAYDNVRSPYLMGRVSSGLINHPE
ncbi:MAG: multicopper oxidase domain-containing protein [Actinomycetales bacterium]|nr:multicopper oxidase domain-containing protein [Actinomycetales bacterium]